MQDTLAIFMYISCPTKEEAYKHCEYLVSKELCGTAKVIEGTTLFFPGEKKANHEEVFLLQLKTTKTNMMEIQKYILENHSWGTPCIEVVPIVGDFC